MAEGGPLPPADPERLAEHEQRLAEWKREIEEERIDEAIRGVDVEAALEKIRRRIGEL
jgi:ABC-type Fe3+-citrate transport system substrate-binding protein